MAATVPPTLEGAGDVDPVEAEDDVGGADGVGRFGRQHGAAGRAGMQRVIGREGRADFEIGDDARAQALGQRDARVPGIEIARYAAGQDHRMLGMAQQIGGFLDGLGRGRALDLRHVALGVDRGDRLGQFRFLHLGVEIDVSRPARRGVGDPAGAQHGFARGDGGGRLVVPFGVAAHQRALVARGMDPVDPRPPLGGVDWPGGAEHDHRHAIAPGVEERHGGVHQADIGMHRRRHRLAGDLGIAVRDGDRAFFVQAEQHLRPLVAEVIHQAVVQAAIAGAGIERDIGDIERAQRIGHHVAAEAGGVDAGRDRAIEGRYGRIARGLLFCAIAFGSHCWILRSTARAGGGGIQPDHEP